MKAATVLCLIAVLDVRTGTCFKELSSLETSLQRIMDRATLLSRGTALSLGVALPTGTIALSSGKVVKGNGSKEASAVDPNDAFAMGSTMKMYTAAAILRLVDEGKFELDQPALPLFDELWTRLNGTSFAKIMGPQIQNVTVRQLLQMRSGIPDFDTLESRGYQFDHPDEDLGPVKELSFLDPGKGFDCDPGTCGEYSSSNYEVLGLILAQQAGVQSWDAYNQSEGIPKDVLAQMPSTAFALHGPCSQYTQVHAYSIERTPPVDVFDVSCTNGWTCGNLISNGADAAFFVRALLGNGQRVLKSATQTEMLKTSPLTQGWSKGLEYGLGVMDMSAGVKQKAGSFVGHGGETYGFNAQTGYSKEHDFGISVVANTENTFLISMLVPQLYATVVKWLKKTEVSSLLV